MIFFLSAISFKIGMFQSRFPKISALLDACFVSGLYLSLGTIWSTNLEEEWSLIDSIYFASMTCSEYFLRSFLA